MPHPMSEPWTRWEPIETAPKTGESVLLYEGFEGVVCQGWYMADDAEWFPCRGKAFWVQPTHWMPLPAPPEAEQ